MSFLLVASSLRISLFKLNKTNLINQMYSSTQFYCTSKPIELISRLKKNLTDKEEAEIIDYLTNCDTGEEDWRDKLFKKLLGLHFNKEVNFNNLVDEDKIKLLTSDFNKLNEKRLATPKFIKNDLIADLSKVWDDDKARLHMLAFEGIKQFKSFKISCDRQITKALGVKRAKKVKKVRKRKYEETEIEETEENEEQKSSFFFKRTGFNYYNDRKMMNSVFEGQNLVLDFSFTEDCLISEHNTITSQVQRIIKFNLESDQPFNLWFTSLNKEARIHRSLTNQNVLSPKHFINQRSEHFIDLFPRGKLIYLSPDAEETIEDFDREAVYILGALVDRYSDEPLTFNSAKKHNIRSFKLPLEKHVILTDLATDLSFYSVSQMLNYMQLSYATWDNAFRQYLQQDRKMDELELIDKFNPSFKKYNRKQIQKYQLKTKYQYKNRLFQRISG